MADLKDARPPPQRSFTGDFSDAGSDRLETETLNEEELPSYPEDQAGSSTVNAPHLPPEKSGPMPGQQAPGPTASAPFNFPTADLPAYQHTVDFQKPLAIPQVTPRPDAPFIRAYPTDLLSYGIPAESWYNFIDTVSAFLSAKVSQQAVHHASDVAKSIQDFHKRYVMDVKRAGKKMGDSAKRFNPFGIIGGAIGLTVGTAGHAVGSVFNVPLSMIQKPKTPRERAQVYLAAANKDWFRRRGLHALLLTTTELSAVLDISQHEILGAVHSRQTEQVSDQLGLLRQWIGDVQVRESPTQPETDHESMSSSRAEASSSRLTPMSSRQSKGKSSAAGEFSGSSQFSLGAQTLWLVLTQEKNVQTVEVDGRGSSTRH